VLHLKDILLYNPEKPLLFTQVYFWAFYGIIFAIYSLLYPKSTLRNTFLFLVSLFFYWKTSGLFFLLLLFSICADYYLGNRIHRAQSKFWRRFFVTLSVTISLSILAYFKYSEFIISTINDITGADFRVFNFLAFFSNSITGSHFDIDAIGLPVGISFFIFQTISYTVDIYRKKIKPVRNIIDYGFFVSFFPQLVAGPIVRASEFIPQLYKRYHLTVEEFGYAVYLILGGLMKKMFIGDYLAVNFIDRIFANPASYTGFENLMALYGYSLQVYCDFSGYTDIALGIALLLGFRLPMNFNSPYKADNIGNFWKRWHMSLSSWLKDYLYIPLGGNRKGAFRTNVNLMITMLLGGLWHGASWQFVIWGGLNGVGIVFYKYWKRISPYEKSRHWLVHLWKVFLTFNFITFTRIWFRSESMEGANQLIRQVWNNFSLNLAPEIISGFRPVFAIMLAGYIIHWLPSGFKFRYRDWFIQSPLPAKICITCLVIVAIYQVWTAKLQPFIYFQF
jgi:D-alanyl-lipoteichoic acid acyltransferase DltB (MBOAT superfamily)